MQESTTEQAEQYQSQERNDRMEFEGIVEEALPAALFRVKLSSGQTILATLAGKLRMNHIRVLVGDYVAVECSPYDLSRGRVVWRR